jgi:2-polyprenyl-6-methoxyphenol hydroxylase-like FAD-dependent oxidoreductase
MHALQARQREHTGSHKPSVLISGAGPAGLIRAILSLVKGHPTQVIEARPENADTRENMVALAGNAIPLLMEYGIYQYLIEHNLTYPPCRQGNFTVRLKDLEAAMKEVIRHLSPKEIIAYDTTITGIPSRKKGELVLSDKTRHSPDLLVIAEGSRSSTNDLLKTKRIDVLPKIPVIAAILTDPRPHIRGIFSLYSYLSITLIEQITTIYTHTLYLFKATFQGEHFFNKGRSIAGSLVLQVPGQDYLGTGLNAEESERLLHHANTVRALKQQLDNAKTPEEITRLTQAYDDAKKNYDSYADEWIKMSVCFANFLSLIRFVLSCGCTSITWASIHPITQKKVVSIGADRAQTAASLLGNTLVLNAGDSLATVDPTTGLGCRTALESSEYFETALDDLSQGKPRDLIQHNYTYAAERLISSNHAASKRLRRLYRPDALS